MGNLYTKQADSVTFDNLVADLSVTRIIKGVTLKAGQGVLPKGRVVGLIKIGAITSDATGNTGNGTITGLAIGKGVKVGNYTIACIEAAANGGTFSVIDPDGVMLKDAIVGVAYSGAIAFTVNDGSTDFIVGDKFTVAVAVGSELAVSVDSTAKDGSGLAEAILTDEVDTGAPGATDNVVAQAYVSGKFNRQALTFGGTDDAADHEARLRELGIFLTDNIPY